MSQGKCIVAIGSRDELPIPCRKVIIYAITSSTYNHLPEKKKKNLIDARQTLFTAAGAEVGQEKRVISKLCLYNRYCRQAEVIV